MSMHFSANQYEDAFRPKKLKNWTVPRAYKERPSTLDGFTQIIATSRGHLKDDVPRSKESPWGTFMGTWDMPCNIPPARPSYTARSRQAADNLKNFKETTPLNNAVNGYKPFGRGKVVKSVSPIVRPKTPSPPHSTRTPEKSAKTPNPAASQRKSASPRASSKQATPLQGGSPAASKPATPIRMIDDEVPVSPAPSMKSDSLPLTPDSGRPRTKESIRSARSLAEVAET